MPEITEPIADGGILRTTDTMFLNSKCIFIEYYDVIKVPWFILLSSLGNSSRLREIVDISPIYGLNNSALYEWYVNRTDRNFFKCFKTNTPDGFDLDELLHTLSYNEAFYTDYSEINFSDVLLYLITSKMVKDVKIYTEDYNEHVEHDLRLNWGDEVEYVYGDLKEVLEDIPDDSTYIFSDIFKLITLDECGKLPYSSICVAGDYDYNYTYDENGIRKLAVNVDYLIENNVFKISYFNAMLPDELFNNMNKGEEE